MRIFVSSPGDVAEERIIAQRVLQRIAHRYENSIQIEPIFWEHEPLTATSTFQDQIVLPSESDIVITILWSRIGTRLPAHITREDGTRYDSGTEFEFEDAAAGFRKSGTPDLMVYRKMADPVVSLSDRAKRDERIQQWDRLNTFIEKWFHAKDGSLTAAFHPFDTSSRFEEHLELHLAKLIEKGLRKKGLPLVNDLPREQPAWQNGSPFRGLDVFEFEHSPIFFGRTQATEEVLNRLRSQAAKQKAFLLITGMSGCGKSSLVRAGVLPMLTQSGVVEGVGAWRYTVMKPSGPSGDLFDRLSESLLQAEALPELASDVDSPQDIASNLRENPSAAKMLGARKRGQVGQVQIIDDAGNISSPQDTLAHLQRKPNSGKSAQPTFLIESNIS